MLTLETNVLLGKVFLEEYIRLNGYESNQVADIAHSILSNLAQKKGLDTDFLEGYVSKYERTLKNNLLFKAKRKQFNDFLDLVKAYTAYQTEENAQAILNLQE